MELVIVFVYIILCVVAILFLFWASNVYNKFMEKGIDYEARSYGRFCQEFNNIKDAFMYNENNEKKYKCIIEQYKHEQIKHDVRIVDGYLKMIDYSNTIIGFILAGISLYIAIWVDNIVEDLDAILKMELQGKIIYNGMIIFLYVALIFLMVRNIKVIKIQYIYVDIATEILNSKE